MGTLPVTQPSSNRRRHYRVRCDETPGLVIRVWKVAPGVPIRDKPLPSQELKAIVHDMSEGGLGMTLQDRTGQQPQIAASDRIRVEIALAGVSVIQEARLRPAGGTQRPDALRTGVELKFRDTDRDSRLNAAQLTKIIASLHRMEVQKLRQETITAKAG